MDSESPNNSADQPREPGEDQTRILKPPPENGWVTPISGQQYASDQPQESEEDQTRILKPPPESGWVTPPPVGWSSDAEPGPVSGPLSGATRVLEAPVRPRKRLFRRIIRDVVIPLLVAFGIAMFAQATLAKPYQIPSGSMLPTIQLNDRILANRLVYRFQSIERGDVIVFEPPNPADPSIPYVKRVIGLPGDTVEIRSGKVLVNGEEFKVGTASLPTYIKPIDTVPEGMLFVLGDNRNESSDSHVWGYVPVDNVIGRAEFIYWPPKHMQWLGN